MCASMLRETESTVRPGATDACKEALDIEAMTPSAEHLSAVADCLGDAAGASCRRTALT